MGSEGRATLLDLKAQEEQKLQAQLEKEGVSYDSVVVKEGLQRLESARRPVLPSHYGHAPPDTRRTMHPWMQRALPAPPPTVAVAAEPVEATSRSSVRDPTPRHIAASAGMGAANDRCGMGRGVRPILRRVYGSWSQLPVRSSRRPYFPCCQPPGQASRSSRRLTRLQQYPLRHSVPMGSEPQLPASAADPPPRQCICYGVNGTRCINVAIPSRGGPHHNGRWCAECRPVEGEEKCGCLCGGCEVHDYGSVLPRIYARTPHDALRPSSVTSPPATVSSVQPRRAVSHPWLRPQLEAAPRSRPRVDAAAYAPSVIAAVTQREHVARSARHRGSVPTRLDLAAVSDRSLVTRQRRPLPPPPNIVLMRTPDAYVAASCLNRNATAKQRGRRGFRDPIVDAGWGLFLSRDMIRNDVVVDYRFVDGREGTEVDRLSAAQLRQRYPDPMWPPTHVLQTWGSSSYWDALPCKGIGGFANSRVNQQNCLFRGYRICVGKTGLRADSEVFVSYSASKSYQWACDLAKGDDFHARRSVPPTASSTVKIPTLGLLPLVSFATTAGARKTNLARAAAQTADADPQSAAADAVPPVNPRTLHAPPTWCLTRPNSTSRKALQRGQRRDQSEGPAPRQISKCPRLSSREAEASVPR